MTLRKIGNAPAKPHFETVVTPTHWNKTFTEKGETPPLKKQYGDFFEPLVTRLNGAGFADKALFHYGPSGRIFPSRIDPGIGYAATLEEREHAWVGLHIQTHDNNLNKQVFDMLAQDQERIESSIDLRPGEEWCWYRHSPFTYSSINLRSAGALHDQPEKLWKPEPGCTTCFGSSREYSSRAWKSSLRNYRSRAVVDPRFSESALCSRSQEYRELVTTP